MKERDWNDMEDVTVRDTYTHLLHQDMRGSDEEGREGQGRSHPLTMTNGRRREKGGDISKFTCKY